VEVVRFLIRLGDNVKIGPEVLVRTMRNPDGNLSGGVPVLRSVGGLAGRHRPPAAEYVCRPGCGRMAPSQIA
jgi:hypothetical protein